MSGRAQTATHSGPEKILLVKITFFCSVHICMIIFLFELYNCASSQVATTPKWGSSSSCVCVVSVSFIACGGGGV